LSWPEPLTMVSWAIVWAPGGMEILPVVVPWAMKMMLPVLEVPAGHVGLPVPQLTVTSFNVYVTKKGFSRGVGSGMHEFTRKCVSRLPGVFVVRIPVNVALLGGPVDGLRVPRLMHGSSTVITVATEVERVPVPDIVIPLVLSALAGDRVKVKAATPTTNRQRGTATMYRKLNFLVMVFHPQSLVRL
jgi:hypothetical protein